MSTQGESNKYALGSDDAEHERLIRQASWLIAPTEQFFRRAGIGSGQRVLDLGSGVGDVSLIAAQLVGPKGEVCGAQRHPRAVAMATPRVAALGLRHVRFAQVDVSDLPMEQPFDAAVGRYILAFLRDPAPVLRSVWRLVQPGGAVAFLEPWWGSFLEDSETLPLWRASADLMVETFTLLGAERWMPDVLQSLAPQAEALGLPVAKLGDLHTLYERLLAEAALHNVPPPLPAIMGAWVRKPLAGQDYAWTHADGKLTNGVIAKSAAKY
jgi:SAM-dependent methyltransferase